MTHLGSEKREREKELKAKPNGSAGGATGGLALSGHYVYAALAASHATALTLTSCNCRLFIAAFNEQITSDKRTIELSI